MDGVGAPVRVRAGALAGRRVPVDPPAVERAGQLLAVARAERLEAPFDDRSRRGGIVGPRRVQPERAVQVGVAQLRQPEGAGPQTEVPVEHRQVQPDLLDQPAVHRHRDRIGIERRGDARRIAPGPRAEHVALHRAEQVASERLAKRGIGAEVRRKDDLTIGADRPDALRLKRHRRQPDRLAVGQHDLGPRQLRVVQQLEHRRRGRSEHRARRQDPLLACAQDVGAPALDVPQQERVGRQSGLEREESLDRSGRQAQDLGAQVGGCAPELDREQVDPLAGTLGRRNSRVEVRPQPNVGAQQRERLVDLDDRVERVGQDGGRLPEVAGESREGRNPFLERALGLGKRASVGEQLVEVPALGPRSGRGHHPESLGLADRRINPRFTRFGAGGGS